MTEEQADKMIDLLETICSKLDDLEAGVMGADSGSVVVAINDLERTIRNKR